MANVNVDKLVEGLERFFLGGENRLSRLVIQLKADGLSLDLFGALLLEGPKVLQKIVDEMDGVVKGKEKREALVKFIDDIIELPRLLEWFDGKIIGWVVSGIVEYYKKVGKLDEPVDND